MASNPSVKFQQARLNWWCAHYLKGVNPLQVDGHRGPATAKRTAEVRYYLGQGLTIGQNKRYWTPGLTFRTTNGNLNNRRYSYKERRRGYLRRVKQKLRWTQQHVWSYVAPGVTRFDGVPCALWLAKKLQEVRNAGRWQGHLNSGWRSPAYSQSLCYNMCGRPSCPGKCAGLASNHAGTYYPRGAVDVSDYWTFRNECARLGNGLHNGMPGSDPVHFSVSGF